MSTSTTFRYHTEHIHGAEIEKPLPKKLHAMVQRFLLLWFTKLLQDPNLSDLYDCLAELNVICSAERIVPDVTLFKRKAHFIDGDLAEPPLLAVEISSPGQSFSSLLEKCEILANQGTPTCWIILPEKRQAWIFSDFTLVQVTGTLDCHFSIPGLPLTEIWTMLEKDGQ